MDSELGQKVVDWWKQRPGSYVEKPTNTSQRNMRATQKFWAPRDAIYLADKSDSPPPVDAFKNVYSAKAKRDDNLMNWTKPTQKPAPDEEKSKRQLHEKTAKPRPQTANKFSAFENQFKKREIDKARQSMEIHPSEMRPMFSSFNKSGIFPEHGGITPAAAAKVRQSTNIRQRKKDFEDSEDNGVVQT